MTCIHENKYIDIIYSSYTSGILNIFSSNNDLVFSTNILEGENKFLSISLPPNTIWTHCRIDGPEGFKIMEIRHRKDFFDFFNLKQQHHTEKIFSTEKYKNCMKTIRSGVTFFVTYHCTYKCPFCWQRHESANYAAQKCKNFDPDLLAKSFNRLLPSFIYFTGGEPTLYKNIFSMINKLDQRIKCRITSNLGPSFDVKKFISLISPDRFEMLMFSYHPSETTKTQFLNKIDTIIANGFTNILVESVLYSDDITDLLDIKDDLISRNIIRRYDPCFLPDGKMHILSPKSTAMAHQLQDQGIQEQSQNDIALRQIGNMFANKSSLILCPAGHKNFHIDPAGDIYPCMSALDRSRLFGKWALPHYQPIGNIQDTDFDYLPEPIICWEAFRCSACDYELLQTGWRFLGECHPPLPE